MKIAYVNKVDGYLSYVGREVGILGRLVGNQRAPNPKGEKTKGRCLCKEKMILIHSWAT
jgi:hypothetical protein